MRTTIIVDSGIRDKLARMKQGKESWTMFLTRLAENQKKSPSDALMDKLCTNRKFVEMTKSVINEMGLANALTEA
ncbi:MAG: hypothetical protein V1494_02890 [Candidatus Diapherotrites archaeon]